MPVNLTSDSEEVQVSQVGPRLAVSLYVAEVSQRNQSDSVTGSYWGMRLGTF